MRLKKFVLFIIFIYFPFARSAKILGIFHMISYSHYQLGEKLMKALASIDHEVTMIAPFPDTSNTTNYNHIFLDGIFELKEEIIKKNMFEKHGESPFLNMIHINEIGLSLTEKTLKHPKVKKLINSEEHFDLVIMENFINEAFKGFCYRFHAPCIVVNTFGSSRWSNDVMGNPGPPSYVPDVSITYNIELNFWGRLYNSIAYLFGQLHYHWLVFPKHNELLQKYFSGAPHLEKLLYNTSLMLLNSHISTNLPVPRVPGMIDIGGYHVDEPKKLPVELQNYLDNSKEGVILFSMGSILRSQHMPTDKLISILKSFSKLKENVLFKWEDEYLPNVPKNVKISKWLPQRDILAHPNLKLLITHGGLLSTIEAVYCGITILGIPIFADQAINIGMAESAGYGISISFSGLNEEVLDKALHEMLTNPKYTKAAKYQSKIMHDEPMKPMEKAIFWIEYVLRHNGAPHLRVRSLDLKWYSYLLLDVVAFISITIIAGILILYIIVKNLCKLLCKLPAKKNEKIN